VDWSSLASVVGALVAASATIWALEARGRGRRSQILADLEILRSLPEDFDEGTRAALETTITDAVARHAFMQTPEEVRKSGLGLILRGSILIIAALGYFFLSTAVEGSHVGANAVLVLVAPGVVLFAVGSHRRRRARKLPTR
jgi:Flp pilus assembly protein TadB